MKIEVLSYNDNIHSVIINTIEKKPIIVEADSFSCKWSQFYKRTHWTHSFVIVDVDIQNRLYYCEDIYSYNMGRLEISFEELELIADGLCVENIGDPASLHTSVVLTKLLWIAEDKIRFAKGFEVYVLAGETETWRNNNERCTCTLFTWKSYRL